MTNPDNTFLRRALAGLGAVVLAGASPPWPAMAAETVRMVAARYSDRTGPYFDRMAREFQSANPGIHIAITMRPPDATPPPEDADIAIVAPGALPALAKEGRVEPLDRLMSAEFRGRFIPAMLPPGRIGGATFGLPIAASARALFTNTDLLAKAAIARPPATWDELLADAARLKAAGIAAFGLAGVGADADAEWYCALWTMGGEAVGGDGAAAFAGPQGVAALTLFRTLIDQGGTEADPGEFAQDDLQGLFLRGGVAMLLAPPTLIERLATDAPGLAYGVAAIPRGARAATCARTDLVVLAARSRVKPTAWKFIEFLFTRAARVEFDREEGFLPTTRPAAADAWFTGDEHRRAFVALLPNAHFPPAVAGWDTAAGFVGEAVRSVYLGRAAPDAALAAAAAQAKPALGQ